MNDHRKMKSVTGMLPDDKALLYGAQVLTDAELLAVLLRNGSKGQSVLAMCEDILREIGGTLAGLLTTPAFPGGTGGTFIYESGFADAHPISEAVSETFREDVRFAGTEEVHLALLDIRCRLIRRVMLHRGTLRSSAVSPREVFAQALQCRAASFILVHNHPSGDCQPSGDDRRTTELLQELGESMQIPMLDHIIIGDPGYYSFKDNGELKTRE